MGLIRQTYQAGLAKIYDSVTKRYESWMALRKSQLLSEAEGCVVEIGAGSGNNLRHLQRVDFWLGIDVSRPMLAKATPKFRFKSDVISSNAPSPHLPRPRCACVLGVAEDLPLPDASIDGIISTLVLCSVRSPPDALREIKRVLKPGGRFFFVEHIQAPDRWGQVVQTCVGPGWRICADGCRVNQQTLRLIESAGFSRLDFEQFEVPFPIVPPFLRHHLAGIATR